MTKNQREGLFWILLASSADALIPALAKTLYQTSSLSPMDMTIWRFIFAVPLIWILVFLRHRTHTYRPSQKVPVRKELFLGAIYCGVALTAFLAWERLPVSASVLLYYYTCPTMVVVLSFLMNEKVSLKDLLALLIVLLGVVLSVSDFTLTGADDIVGIGLAVASGVFAAIYYLAEKRLLKDVEDVSGASAYMLTGTLIVLLLLAPFSGLQLPQDPPALLGLFGIGALTVLTMFGINLCIQKVGASQAAMLSATDLVMIMIVSVVLLSETVFPIQWLGAALIVTGVVILELHPRYRLRIHIRLPHPHLPHPHLPHLLHRSHKSDEAPE